jgi:formylglycine-generating enzyme required for sulfatase activity
MVCFTNSVEFCKQEIQIAQRHGLDGFALDFGEWGNYDAKAGKFTPTRYIASAERMFEAARQLGTGFRLLLTPEYSVQPINQNVEDMVRRFHKHPNVMRWQGKMALSSYGLGAEYRFVIEKLKADGIGLFFVPFVVGDRYPMSRSVESSLAVLRDQPHIDGEWLFETDDSPRGILLANANARRACLFAGKLYMAGVSPHYNSANVRDMQGLAGYAGVWEGIVRDGPEWVEIVTWNDYNEDTNLMHYRWQRQYEKFAYNRDGSYLDATGYFAQWYKAARAPAITQDKLYFAHRSRSCWLTRAWDAKAGRWVDTAMGTQAQFDQFHDDVQDNVYATTFLTAPAELTIQIGAAAPRTFAMPAGVAHAQVPLAGGVVHFTVRRGGAAIIDTVGRRRIIDEGTITKENSPYQGQRMFGRIWAGAAAAGKPMRIEAEDAKLAPNAAVVTVSGVRGVATRADHDSGFTAALRGLTTGMYAVRVIYSNPGPDDARLTLTSDGPPRAKDDDRYYIPVYQPPTGEGKFATASFFWTLYDTSTFLKLAYELGLDNWDPKSRHTEWDDQGAAVIDAIELVRVEQPQPPPPVGGAGALPEMVPISGGDFVMGSGTAQRGGAPDELPAHKVKLSPFAMGRFEVTNDEYERFDPTHRKYRDGYSWRGREPVIYVSWVDAVRYCNWLSRQAGLAPAYEEQEVAAAAEPQRKEKQWVLRAAAEGFRLPTEAEWEYVAGGRGEGRAYPWGNDKPQPKVHGNFEGPAALSTDPRTLSQEAQGTMVVGSYPAGASRDGVMDQAGNVAEWCSDWYHPYASGDTPPANPCNQTPSHSRVIRGGSWGYYNFSQRVADREFNNPRYPGYIYVGFRLAIGEAGLRKLPVAK